MLFFENLRLGVLAGLVGQTVRVAYLGMQVAASIYAVVYRTTVFGEKFGWHVEDRVLDPHMYVSIALGILGIVHVAFAMHNKCGLVLICMTSCVAVTGLAINNLDMRTAQCYIIVVFSTCIYEAIAYMCGALNPREFVKTVMELRTEHMLVRRPTSMVGLALLTVLAGFNTACAIGGATSPFLYFAAVSTYVYWVYYIATARDWEIGSFSASVFLYVLFQQVIAITLHYLFMMAHCIFAMFMVSHSVIMFWRNCPVYTVHWLSRSGMSPIFMITMAATCVGLYQCAQQNLFFVLSLGVYMSSCGMFVWVMHHQASCDVRQHEPEKYEEMTRKVAKSNPKILPALTGEKSEPVELRNVVADEPSACESRACNFVEAAYLFLCDIFVYSPVMYILNLGFTLMLAGFIWLFVANDVWKILIIIEVALSFTYQLPAQAFVAFLPMCVMSLEPKYNDDLVLASYHSAATTCYTVLVAVRIAVLVFNLLTHAPWMLMAGVEQLYTLITCDRESIRKFVLLAK